MSDIARCPVCRDKDGRCDCQISDFCDRIKQLEDAIDEVRQTQDMLYDEHYDLQAWRDNHIVTEQIFEKALEEK